MTYEEMYPYLGIAVGVVVVLVLLRYMMSAQTSIIEGATNAKSLADAPTTTSTANLSSMGDTVNDYVEKSISNLKIDIGKKEWSTLLTDLKHACSVEAFAVAEDISAQLSGKKKRLSDLSDRIELMNRLVTCFQTSIPHVQESLGA